MRHTTLDPESTRALAYLQSLLNDDAPPDQQLVGEFVDHIRLHPHLVTSSDSVLNLPILVVFVPLAERLLRAHPHQCYADLLLALLQPLPLCDILKFFPRHQFEAAARLLPLEVVLASRIIYNAYTHHPHATAAFVRELDFMPAALQLALSAVSLPEETVQQLETLMDVVASPELVWARWQFLLDRRAAAADAQLAARHAAIVQCLVRARAPVPAQDMAALCAYDVDSFFSPDPDSPDVADGVDWFLPPIALNLYLSLVGKIPWDTIRAPVDRCMAHMARRRRAGLEHPSLDPPLAGLLGALSHNAGHLAHAYLEQYPALRQFDFANANHVAAFQMLALDVVPAKAEFFAHHFAHWRLEHVPQQRLPAALWLISDPDFFRMFDAAWLSDAVVEALPLPVVYELLHSLASYDHSAHALFVALPRAVGAHLAQLNRTFSHPQLWELRKDTLHQLLFERAVDLGHWRAPLATTYLEIVNGRKVRAREPQVEVASHTG